MIIFLLYKMGYYLLSFKLISKLVYIHMLGRKLTTSQINKFGNKSGLCQGLGNKQSNKVKQNIHHINIDDKPKVSDLERFKSTH